MATICFGNERIEKSSRKKNQYTANVTVGACAELACE
jgi:hypothetical protein